MFCYGAKDLKLILHRYIQNPKGDDIELAIGVNREQKDSKLQQALTIRLIHK